MSRFVGFVRFMGRVALGSALLFAAHAAEPMRTDQLVLRNGAVATTLPAGDASGLALDALGRAGVGQSRYSVWAITNREAATKAVRLESIDGTFTLALSIAADTRVIVRSPVVRGQATHRLVVDGDVVTARDSAQSATFVDATLLTPATTANRAPVILGAAPTVAERAPDLAYAPIALDADHEPVTFAIQGSSEGFTFDAPNGVFRYRAGASGPQSLAIVARDARAGEARQTLALRSVADFCPIMPLTVAESVVAEATVGQRFDQIPRANGSGNYSFLTWTGANDAPALAASLALPGDSDRYVDPDDATDHQLDVADFAQGAPGSMNASAVRAALDALVGRDIVLPLFDATRGQGSRFDFRVARFATFRLHDYRLTGQGYLSLEYRGEANCYNDVPTALPQSLTMPQDTVLALTVLGTDPENDALTYRIVEQPTHGTLTGTAPNLTYTPASGYVGTDRFTFAVSDGEFESAPAAIDLEVVRVARAPIALSESVATDEDAASAITLSAIDGNGDPLTYTIVGDPQHGTLSGTAPSVTYTPAADFHGTDQFRFRAADGIDGDAEATVTVNVAPVNDAPLATSDTVSADEDESIAIILTGTDVDGDTLTYALVTSPARGALTGVAPDLTYTPASNFSGTDTLTFRTNDGTVDSEIATLTIAVAPINDAPVGAESGMTLDEDATVAVTLRATDEEGDALSYRVVEAPIHGRLTGTAPNLEYAPDADFNGTDQIAWVANDGGADSALATVTLTVAPVNDAPVATVVAIGTDEDTSVALTLGGSDVDGDALAVTLVESPAHGTLSGTAPDYTYAPAPNFAGRDTLTFRVDDGKAESAVAVATIDVAAVNDAPLITSQPVTTAIAGSAYSYAVAATDVDGDTLQYALDTSIAGMSIDANGVVHWVPSAGGSAAVVVRVTDAAGAEATQAYTIAVTASSDNAPRIVSTAPTRATADATLAYDLDATDADAGQTLAYALDRAPPGATIDAATGAVAWTAPGAWADGIHQDDPYCRAAVGTNEPWLAVNDGLPIFTSTSGDLVRWDVSATDPTLVTVPTNGATSMYVVPYELHDGAVEFEVGSTAFDDDWYGIVWGWRNEQQHYRLAWSRGSLDKTVVIDAPNIESARLRIERVMTDGPLNIEGQVPGVDILAEVSGRNWRVGRTYRIALDVRPGRAQIVVRDGAAVIAAFDVRDDALVGGRIGFYNYSQADTKYRVRPIPRVDLADLVVEDLAWNGAELAAVVRNRGLVPAAAGATFRIEGLDATSGVLKDGIHLGMLDALAPGATQRVALPFALDRVSFDQIRATIEPTSALGECRIDNNVRSAGVFVARVTDPTARNDRQAFAVRVDAANHSPQIASSPPRGITIGRTFDYTVDATDTDLGDRVSYELVSGPPGMAFARDTGHLTWTPKVADIGATYPIVVRAADLPGASVEQRFDLRVHRDPVFVSQPKTWTGPRAPNSPSAIPYVYSPIVHDADGDTLSFRLLEGPAGMVVDPLTGRVTWTANWNDQVRRFVEIEVRDDFGGVAVQSYVLAVAEFPSNPLPVITSVPPTTAQRLVRYRYQAVVYTPIGGSLWRIVSGPPGMSINATTGLLEWVPAMLDFGSHAVTIEVADTLGGTASQTWTIAVDPWPGNADPQIFSSPALLAPPGSLYEYRFVATDPDGDALRATLTLAPAGMLLDAATRTIRWTPTLAQVGEHPVILTISDGRGGATAQSFMLEVRLGNSAPAITSTPVLLAKVGRAYRYDVDATDADGGTLSYSLPMAPAGMTIDPATGVITWTPATAADDVPVTVHVGDGTLSTDQFFRIDVVPAAVTLAVDARVAPNVIDAGGTTTLTVDVTGAVGSLTTTATLDGEPLALEADGTTAITSSAFGAHRIAVVATDAFDTASAETSFSVRDPSDTTPPTVSLDSPIESAEVTKPTDVVGRVDDASLASWVLGYRESNQPDTTPVTILAQGTDSFASRTIAQFDPTLLFNGQYVIILQATDRSGNTSFDSVVVRVTGAMKVGHFSITFEDVSIPVAGMPVTVTRTYDTRQRNQDLDFGHGWSVDYQNVRVRESHKLGFSWLLESTSQGGLAQHCVRSNGNRTVTVTLPDGQVESFRAKFSPECVSIGAETTGHLVFEAIDGTDSTLAQTDYGLIKLLNVAGYGTGLADPEQPTTPLDPRHYVLTTPEGMIFELDQNLGITKVTEPNGNTLTYAKTGVTHSTGVGVTFTRDPATDRITAITLPDGESIEYGYDTNGDLVTVKDQVDQTTSFTYKTTPKHYLEDIKDARGVRVSRNEYDDDGRLVKTIDADGNEIAYTHDIAGKREVVRDRNKNPQTFVYDDNGWVTAETNALGHTTYHDYDIDGNETRTIDPLGHETTREFDPRGNVTEESVYLAPTTPLTTISTYDARNGLLTQKDARGVVVIKNTYDERTGNLLGTEDAEHNVTTFEYESGLGSNQTGELKGMRDALSQPTTYTVHYKGWRLAETDALGNVTTYTHDDMGRVKTETKTRTKADGTTESQTTAYTYDAKGRVTRTDLPDGTFATTAYNGIDKPERECDAQNRCTVTTYDARGNVSRMDYADGTFETKTYDANGNVLTETDRGGKTTRMVYDKANRLVETIHPDATPGDDSDNPRSKSVYDDAGRLVESIDRLGRSTTYRYDNANRRTHVTDVLSGTTETKYDAVGRRTEVIDAAGNPTTFVYDDAGRLLETHFADNRVAKVEYDALSRKVAEIDPENRRTEFKYDALSRLTKVILAAGTAQATETVYAYDEQGNRVTQTDAELRTTKFAFDVAGREVARELPEGQRETKAYDALGRLDSATDFNGRTTRWQYDAVDRVTKVDYPRDADVTTTYTPTGQRATVTDGRGTSTFVYDVEERLEKKVDADGGIIEYRYDRNGNLTSRISPSQSLVYTYDALNRLDTVTRTIDGEAPLVTRYEYDAVGNRKAMVGGDGIRTEYGYDNRHRLRSLVKKTAAGALLFGMAYAVDASGMRTNVEETDPQGTTRTVAYAYDALKRLTQETIVHRDATRNRTTAWTYDKVGNRLTQTQTIGTNAPIATTYAYDRNDRLLTETTDNVETRYTYDANGNTVTKATPASLVEYGYDDANRLVEMKEGGARTTYRYDADGLRVGQTHFPATGPFVTTSYLQDPTYAYSQVIEEHVSENGGAKKLAATFTFADDLVAQTHYTSSPAGALVPTTRFVHADGFGSTRWLTDATGSLTDTIEYDAFGETIARTGTTDVEHLYRGEQFDPNLGFYYLRARYYAPNSGRFLTQDSFYGFNTDPQTLHKYVYAGGNPTNGIDPSGHLTLVQASVAIGVGAIIGAVAVPVHDYALGRATTVGDVAMGAVIGAATTAAILTIGPVAAVGAIAYGAGYSGAMTYDVYVDPGKTWGQKVAASALLLAAVAGPAYATRFSGKAWGSGRLSLNDKRILHDAGAADVRAFWESHGFTVCVECYVRNPYYKIGRRYDLIVRDSTGEYIGIEYKSTEWAVANKPSNQVRADGWIEKNGGEIFGSNADATGFTGGKVTKVINLGPSTSARL